MVSNCHSVQVFVVMNGVHVGSLQSDHCLSSLFLRTKNMGADAGEFVGQMNAFWMLTSRYSLRMAD